MYKNGLVATIVSGGKSLTELPGQRYFLPFGAEYELLLKNKRSRRAMVSVEIDGEPVSTSRIVIPASGELRLERFVKSLERGNRFKFIERTEAVENHRGTRPHDGTIRVECWWEEETELNALKRRVDELEKTRPWRSPPSIPWNTNPWPPWTAPSWYYQPVWVSQPSTSGEPRPAVFCSTSAVPNPSDVTRGVTSQVTCDSHVTTATTGITVPGSVSEQRFVMVDSVTTEDTSTVITLQLIGSVAEKPVTHPVIERNTNCQTCGNRCDIRAKFCSRCGSALELAV